MRLEDVEEAFARVHALRSRKLIERHDWVSSVRDEPTAACSVLRSTTCTMTSPGDWRNVDGATGAPDERDPVLLCRDVKIVHTADLHLDSPMHGLDRYEGAPVEQVRSATRRAFERLVGDCIDEQVSLLLIAGDLYDGELKDYSTALFLATQMSRLNAAGIRVVWIRGNHDAEAHAITQALRLPANVKELSTEAPETLVLDELGVAVHGQGFAHRKVTSDLAADYPLALPGIFNIGLLHTSLTGREHHASYAPTKLETLLSKGYQYWALGHVHKREVVHEDPWVVFSGNLQGRHIREVEEKGATWIDLEDGRIRSVALRPADVVRWTLLRVQATERVTYPEDLLPLVRDALSRAIDEAEERVVAARLVIEGRTEAHNAIQADAELLAQQFRSVAIELGAERIFLEKIRFETAELVPIARLREEDGAVGALLCSIDRTRKDPDALAALLHGLEDLRRRIPPDARRADPLLRFESPELVLDALNDIERTLIPQLLTRGVG